MPDPTTTLDADPPKDPAPPPAGGPPVPPAGDPPPTTEPLDAAAANRELAEARREAARYRTDLKKLQDAQKTADEAKLTEEEKRTARIAELEKTVAEREVALREKTSYAAVVDAAARLGAAKPSMIHRLIEPDIEFDDDGSSKNVDQLIKDFLKANPEFASTAGRPTGDAGQGARGKSSLTVAEIKKLSAAEINARWSEVSAVLASGAKD